MIHQTSCDNQSISETLSSFCDSSVFISNDVIVAKQKLTYSLHFLIFSTFSNKSFFPSRESCITHKFLVFLLYRFYISNFLRFVLSVCVCRLNISKCASYGHFFCPFIKLLLSHWVNLSRKALKWRKVMNSTFFSEILILEILAVLLILLENAFCYH